MPVLTTLGCVDVILHVRDEKTDSLVRELARRRGISITDAIHEAVSEALASDDKQPSLWDRTEDLRLRMAAFPPSGKMADKAFYDSLSGQED